MFLRSLILVVGILKCSAYESLSQRKSTNQYRAWPCFNVDNCRLYDSHNAVDGNSSSCTRTNTINANSIGFTWWYVDLGGVKSIYNIRILFRSWNRNDNRQNGRFAGFSLYLSNTTNKEEGYRCYINGPDLPPLDFNTTCIGHARYVIYYNERLPERQYPDGYPYGYPEGFQQSSITELCEVDVQGCTESGTYGANCKIKCPEKCQEQRCNILDGTCLGCMPGWIGDRCDNVCPVGRYGVECKKICEGHCKDNAHCNHVTGQCENGCATGWRGPLCDKGCLNWTYGDNCMFNCSGYCLLEKHCNKITGKCDEGCQPGFTSDKCDQVCASGYFGNKCAEKCSNYCHNENNCNHITGICYSGCKDGYVGGKCQQVCRQGYHGPNCSRQCSYTCSNNSCFHEDGRCNFGCEPGYLGIKCSQNCASLTFGKDCARHCSGHCINNETCDYINGICNNGCTDGYTGPFCELVCPSGHFGENCSGVCSQKCISPCYHVDGSCDCTPGWKGTPNCDKDCLSGYFGVNCDHQCSRHCAYNETCNKFNGSCPRGCQKNFMGDTCQFKALESVATGSIKADSTGSMTIGLIFSITLNIFLLFVVLIPRLRTLLIKRKFNKGKKAILDTETYETVKDVDQQYQDLETTNQASNYQELRAIDNEYAYQNLSIEKTSGRIQALVVRF